MTMFANGAAHAWDASGLNTSWGGAWINACGTNAARGCIGVSQGAECNTWRHNARYHSDEFMIQMMIAVEVGSHGAKFCPTQAEGRNKNKSNAWTEYTDLSKGNDSLCVWLCKPGYTGPKCELEVSEATTCDPSLLLRKNYSNITRAAYGTNNEGAVAMFASGHYKGCAKHKKQEHDLILVIWRWLDSGHGAFARQVIMRSERRGWSDMESTATIYPANGSEDILVCKNGYKPNANNTDCVEISSTACKEAQLCGGWAGFDEAAHLFKHIPEKQCYEYRCLEPGYGFVSEDNRTCQECVTDARNGVDPTTGACVKCATGEIYKTVNNRGTCEKAAMFAKDEMKYGKGQTKNTNEKVGEQCWPLTIPDDFKTCIFSGKFTGSVVDKETAPGPADDE